MEPPASFDGWRQILRQRFLRKNRDLGIPSDKALEVFTITAWGTIPDCDRLLQEIPNVEPEFSDLRRLRERLDRYRA
jgi:hypothetical protein